MSAVKRAVAVVESYTYNHRGERVLRAPVSADAQVTVHDEAGQWIGNDGAAGQPLQQAIWLDNYPVALINAPSAGVPEVAYLQPDHLGTPRMAVDPVRDVAIWEWSSKSEVFGNQVPNADADGDGVGFELALRFPGQQATDASGMFYNYQRDYDPAVGRYSQSDPIGLAGGAGTYAYVQGGPVGRIDPLGLKDCVCASASFGEIRDQLPSKSISRQVGDGVSSYIEGVAWGGTAVAARVGLLGNGPKHEAVNTNSQLGGVVDQIASHPGQTAMAVAAVASTYPAQMLSRLGAGVAVSTGFSPYIGVPVSGLAIYGSAFKAAYQHPDAVAAAGIVGEELCR